jgi:transcriptional regulator with XRE-family HTH domain
MAHPADIAVGKRLRLRRKELGLSQTALARDIEISAEKLRRYERGDDRMRTRDLFRAARHLEIPSAISFAIWRQAKALNPMIMIMIL